MNAGIGSARLRNATARMNREKDFLNSITIETDDLKALEEKLQGKASMVRVTKAIRDQVIDPGTVQFLSGGQVVSLDEIAESRRVLADCQKTVKRFGGEV